MSLIIDIAAMVGGMLAEYASSKQWSKTKIFSISSGIFFTIFTIYVLSFPSDKGIFVGILIAICLGITLGLCITGLIYCHEKQKK